MINLLQNNIFLVRFAIFLVVFAIILVCYYLIPLPDLDVKFVDKVLENNKKNKEHKIKNLSNE